MHSFKLIPLLIATLAAIAQGTSTSRACYSELCGSDFSSALADVAPIPVKRRITNAERLARGIAPAPPARRATPVRRTTPSSVPTYAVRGVLQVTNTDNNQILGFVSSSSFSQAQLRYQPDLATALIVTFSLPVGQTSASSIDAEMENSDLGFSLLGLIQGRDDTDSTFATGSFQYGYLGGVTHSPAGSTPITASNSYSVATNNPRTTESAVWTVDLITGAWTPQWVNPDGSSAPTITFTQGTALYVGGDKGAFATKYPSPVTPVSYKFIAI